MKELSCAVKDMTQAAFKKARDGLEALSCIYGEDRTDVDYHTHDQSWHSWSRNPVAKAVKEKVSHRDAAGEFARRLPVLSQRELHRRVSHHPLRFGCRSMTVCELVQPIDIHWTDLSRVREHAGACFLRIDLRPQLQLPALPGFAPDYRQLVVPGEASDNVMVLDLDPLGVRGLIELPKGAAPWQVKCIPHSDCFCYVTYSGFGGDFTTSAARRGHVALLDYKRLQLLREIEVGAGPNGITVDRFARYAFVANIRGDSVSVLDVARHELIKEIPVGNGPAFVKLTRDGRYALVTILVLVVGQHHRHRELFR